MISVSAEKSPFSNGGYYTGSNPPKFKRRKVSAIRDYPSGCGPNAPRVNVGVDQIKNNSPSVDITEGDQNNSTAVGNIPCSNGVVVVGSQTKDDLADDSSKLLESQNVGAENLPRDSRRGKSNISWSLQGKESILVTGDLVCGSDEVLKKDLLESTEIMLGSKLVTLEEETIATEKMDTCSSTHYPIPFDLVQKEPNYPPRRNVSAVRHFPSGLGDKKCDQHALPIEDRNANRSALPLEEGNANQDNTHAQRDSSSLVTKSFPLGFERNELHSSDGKSTRSHWRDSKTNGVDDEERTQVASLTEERNAIQDEIRIDTYQNSSIPATRDTPCSLGKNELHSSDISHDKIIHEALFDKRDVQGAQHIGQRKVNRDKIHSKNHNDSEVPLTEDVYPALVKKDPHKIDSEDMQGAPSEERNASQNEVHAENCNNAIMTVLREIQVHDDDVVSYKLTPARGKDLAEGQAESRKVELHVTSSSIQKKSSKSSKGKEKHGNLGLPDVNNAEDVQKSLRCSGEIDGEDTEGEMTKEIITYRKDKGDKRRWLVASERYTELNAQKVVFSDDEEGGLVVLGLPAVKTTWRRAAVAIKSSKSSNDTKGKRRKTCSIVEQEKLMLVPFEESTKKAEELKRKSMSKQLHLEKGSHDDGAIVLWENREDSDNGEVEPINDFRIVAKSRGGGVNFPPLGPSSSGNRGARSKVRETLRLFQAVLRKLIQEEETKPKQEKTRQRFDQHAAKILKDKGKYVNAGTSIIGEVPGVEVGDEFHYRVELMIVGLHRQSQGGIDYLRQGGKILATSIVASGGYDNDLDNTDVLIYTGQGGNLTGGDKEPEDQRLERGNLALTNSIDEGNYVRVIRGYKETDKGKISTMYTYDGLYTVERYWEERTGPHQVRVYKFELRRVPGQPELAWKEVKKSKNFRARKGLCVEDISHGKEKVRIGAVNTVDDEKPPPFTYITRVIYPDWCNPIPPKGCGCRSRCTDYGGCACAEKNGGEIPYNHDGAIVEVKPLVYECGPNCGCPPSCYNRVSQYGIVFQLEIFKTGSRGWGVRSLSSIPSGSFICEYMGELLEDKEAEKRRNDEYLFDIGQNYSDPCLKEDLEGLMPDSLQSSSSVVPDVGFTIDAAVYGNVGRFINHSCSPNLYAQNVLYDNEDRRIPHIMLFAAENIPPLQELTYHYNYVIGEVHDDDGNVKVKDCYCGASDCTGRMY